jgi:type III pantothenate kinase
VSLLLDLGNSRLKVALSLSGAEFRLLGEARHRESGIAAALELALDDVALAEAGTALCANVAGEAAGRALAEALQARGCERLEFLRPRQEAGGVRCAYAEPAHLGADRWAALLGARGLTDGACLVVDAGSALTIDAMGPGGKHLGGWIIPGLELMLEALEMRTGDLRVLRKASAGVARAGFPTDTAPAMEEGACIAAAGAVRLAHAKLEARCGPARLLLTGGDAPGLAAALEHGELLPDLVLHGLARMAAECGPAAS